MKNFYYMLIIFISIFPLILIFFISKAILDNIDHKNQTDISLNKYVENFTDFSVISDNYTYIYDKNENPLKDQNSIEDTLEINTEEYKSTETINISGRKNEYKEKEIKNPALDSVNDDFNTALGSCLDNNKYNAQKMNDYYKKNENNCSKDHPIFWNKSNVFYCNNLNVNSNIKNESQEIANKETFITLNSICKDIINKKAEINNFFRSNFLNYSNIVINSLSGAKEDEVFKIEFGDDVKIVLYYLYKFTENRCNPERKNQDRRNFLNRACGSFLCLEYKWRADESISKNSYFQNEGANNTFLISENYVGTVRQYFIANFNSKIKNETTYKKTEETKIVLGLIQDFNQFLDLKNMKISLPNEKTGFGQLKIINHFERIFKKFSDAYRCYDDSSIYERSTDRYFKAISDNFFRVLILYCEYYCEINNDSKHNNMCCAKCCAQKALELTITINNDILGYRSIIFETVQNISCDTEYCIKITEKVNKKRFDLIDEKAKLLRTTINKPVIYIYNTLIKKMMKEE